MRFRPLEDMTLGQRAALTIVLVFVILLALALFGYFGGRWEAAAEKFDPVVDIKCLDFETKEKVKYLTVQGLDKAYVQQISTLYIGIMRDMAGQPKRAQIGVDHAVRVYVSAVASVDSFNPPPC